MKILYFWVTRVIQTTIPSILSNIFQEATKVLQHKTREIHWILVYNCMCIHTPTFCHILCFEMHYEEWQVEFFFHLHWHDCTSFSGTGLAQKTHSSLWSFPQKCSDQASCQGSWLQKHHRPWVYLQLSIHICGQTLKNVHVSQPFTLQAI